MKKTKRKRTWATLVGLSLISTAFVATTDHSYAIGFGGEQKLIPTLVDTKTNTVMKFKFNPSYRDRTLANHYGNREMWREVYTPENANIYGGFVWYSIVPQDGSATLSQTDLGQLYENTQNSLGSQGMHLVPGGGQNLKLGASDPWTGVYYGDNTGTKTIKYGAYKGKKYEYRFIGYNMFGNAVGNPYFPDDIQNSDLQGVDTKAEIGQYWANRTYVYQGWTLPRSIDRFGPADNLNEKYRGDGTGKVKWIIDYFFKDYPAFKDVAIANGKTTLTAQAEYWADYLRPLTDPSKETGVWLMWTVVGGNNRYNTLITTPPVQPNLRLVNYRIYDSQNKLIAEQTRDATSYTTGEPNKKLFSNFVHKGETYRIEVDVKNMPHKPRNIEATEITLKHMYNFDNNVGNHIYTAFSTPILTDTAESPHQNSLNSGETAHFTYNYTVPTTALPNERVEFYAKVPAVFYEMGANTMTSDDNASIVMEIAPENLAVKFEGYHDINKNLVDYVTPNYDMWVKYRVTKTNGAMPVNSADLQIKVTDTKTVTTNQAYVLEGAYDKNGNVISDKILKSEGDYAVFWATLTPRIPKICTEASIPSKWATLGLNAIPTDDKAKPDCLINPDNIIVNNFVAKPKTVFLGETQDRKSVQYTVSYNLTNYNFDKKDKDIPLVYTIDGRVVYTETVSVQSLHTMNISRILPAVNVGEGQQKGRKKDSKDLG